jgi:hypothetical protein
MVWRVGLFYYAGDRVTTTDQIDDFIQEFNGVILLRNRGQPEMRYYRSKHFNTENK